MADDVRRLLEESVPALEFFQQNHIFSLKRIREIVAERTRHEYALHALHPSFDEFRRAIEYEISLEEERREKWANLKLPPTKKLVAVHFEMEFRRRIAFIVTRAWKKLRTPKERGSILLVHVDVCFRWLAFKLRRVDEQLAFSLGRLLTIYPSAPTVWAGAGLAHCVLLDDIHTSRALMLRALRPLTNQPLSTRHVVLTCALYGVEGLYASRLLKSLPRVKTAEDRGRLEAGGVTKRATRGIAAIVNGALADVVLRSLSASCDGVGAVATRDTELLAAALPASDAEDNADDASSDRDSDGAAARVRPTDANTAEALGHQATTYEAATAANAADADAFGSLAAVCLDTATRLPTGGALLVATMRHVLALWAHPATATAVGIANIAAAVRRPAAPRVNVGEAVVDISDGAAYVTPEAAAATAVRCIAASAVGCGAARAAAASLVSVLVWLAEPVGGTTSRTCTCGKADGAEWRLWTGCVACSTAALARVAPDYAAAVAPPTAPPVGLPATSTDSGEASCRSALLRCQQSLLGVATVEAAERCTFSAVVSGRVALMDAVPEAAPAAYRVPPSLVAAASAALASLRAGDAPLPRAVRAKRAAPSTEPAATPTVSVERIVSAIGATTTDGFDVVIVAADGATDAVLPLLASPKVAAATLPLPHGAALAVASLWMRSGAADARDAARSLLAAVADADASCAATHLALASCADSPAAAAAALASAADGEAVDPPADAAALHVGACAALCAAAVASGDMPSLPPAARRVRGARDVALPPAVAQSAPAAALCRAVAARASAAAAAANLPSRDKVGGMAAAQRAAEAAAVCATPLGALPSVAAAMAASRALVAPHGEEPAAYAAAAIAGLPAAVAAILAATVPAMTPAERTLAAADAAVAVAAVVAVAAGGGGRVLGSALRVATIALAATSVPAGAPAHALPMWAQPVPATAPAVRLAAASVVVRAAAALPALGGWASTGSSFGAPAAPATTAATATGNVQAARTALLERARSLAVALDGALGTTAVNIWVSAQLMERAGGSATGEVNTVRRATRNLKPELRAEFRSLSDSADVVNALLVD